jgi:acetyltransferase
MLDALFSPRSIAVLGASSNPAKVGNALVRNLVASGYEGGIHPVTRSGGAVEGRRAYESIGRIGVPVDLAVISIPAPGVPAALRECVSLGVRAAIVISAGFKEAGAEGTALEEELKGIAREGAIRILGPNCLGAMNTATHMNATFAKWMLPAGRIAFFSQSGALGVAVLDWAIGNGIGFSKFISLGNKVDLNETDFIEYLMDDPETGVILGYIEDVVQGRRFLKVATECTRKKPIVLIKSGGTQAGARAASSHTGALAGSESAFSAAFAQTGIIRAAGVGQLFELARVFEAGRIPSGNRLLIVTNAGGPGIIAADQAERLGLTLPLLNNAALDRLREKLPHNASLYNPIDVIGDATSERYEAVLDEALSGEDYDGVIVILTPQAVTDVERTASCVAEQARRSRIPIVTSFMGAVSVKEAVRTLAEAHLPNYSYPEEAVSMYAELVRFGARTAPTQPPAMTVKRETKGVAERIARTIARGAFALPEDDARACLADYGFRFPARGFATDAEGAAREAARVGFPVVMKIDSPDILHKTDVGGVRLGIGSEDAARAAFIDITSSASRRMPRALIRGVSIYEMVPSGREVIIGITHDRTFGHMLMFGMGGIYVEVFKDVSFRIAPATESDIREMVRETRAIRLLEGVRGEEASDIEAVVRALGTLSALVTDFPEIQELDVNPLVVLREGAIALDARIIVQGG